MGLWVYGSMDMGVGLWVYWSMGLLAYGANGGLGGGGPGGASRGVITCAEHKSIAQKVT